MLTRGEEETGGRKSNLVDSQQSIDILIQAVLHSACTYDWRTQQPEHTLQEHTTIPISTCPHVRLVPACPLALYFIYVYVYVYRMECARLLATGYGTDTTTYVEACRADRPAALLPLPVLAAAEHAALVLAAVAAVVPAAVAGVVRPHVPCGHTHAQIIT